MRGNSEFGIRNSGVGSRKPEAAADAARPETANDADTAQVDVSVNSLSSVAQTPVHASTKPDKKQKREIYTDVTKLEPEFRELVEKLIEEGSTFEDVVEIFKERQGPRVTLHAIEVYYRSNLELQKRSIQSLIKRVAKLKRAMADPTSTEAQLADAALFTGLVSLSRRHGRLTVKDAHSLRLQRENLQIRRRILKMRESEARRKKSEGYQRYKFEEERRRKLTLENQKLAEILRKLRQDQTLPADVMEKIQEIYGIVREPYISPKLAEMLPQSETP